MYKKWFAMVCAGLLLGSLAGCGNDGDDPSKPMEVGSGKIGMDSIHTVTMDSLTLARIKSTAAAVVVDRDGKITHCTLDETEFTVPLRDGAIGQPSVLASKADRGDACKPTEDEVTDPKGTSIPWHTQAAAFCRWAVGKTAGEISGLAATDGSSAAIPDCYLKITDFIRTVHKAADRAEVQKVAASQKAALSLMPKASAGGSPQKQEYTVDIAAVTVDGEGQITGCLTDTLQTALTAMDEAFTFVSGGVLTKGQKADGYGMKGASPIKREWYEQAAAFDAYALGKTPEQLSGLKLSETGKTDAVAGCTISLTDMLKNTVQAAKKAA